MHERHEIERLPDAGDNDLAIEKLIAAGPPRQGWELALLARAYRQKGDGRGDRFAARFFADRAMEAGFSEAWLAAPAEGQAAAPRAARPAAAPEQTMGGIADRRRPGPTPYTFNALSACAGEAAEPKDFAWSADNVPCQDACPVDAISLQRVDWTRRPAGEPAGGQRRTGHADPSDAGVNHRT